MYVLYIALFPEFPVFLFGFLGGLVISTVL